MKKRNDICPICNSDNSWQEAIPLNNTYKVKCQRCGIFRISMDALQDNNLDGKSSTRAILSYWIRSNQGSVEIILTNVKIKYILENTILPKPSELINNLILWLGDNQKKISEGVSVSYFDLVPIIGGINPNDVEMIANHLEANNYIVLADIPAGIELQRLVVSLTFTGWERYYELKNTSINSRIAFMAMKFGNDILDRIFNDVIIPAVKETGFDIRRLDQEKRAGLIDDKLRVEIRRSKFLIADLTDDNNGAYWEAGYAEGLGMPVIYICEEEKFKEKKSHFDTNHHLTVQWKDDPDSLMKFADELKATIRATFPTEAKMED